MKQLSSAGKNHRHSRRRKAYSMQTAFHLLLLSAGFVSFHAVHKMGPGQVLYISGIKATTLFSYQSTESAKEHHSTYLPSTQLAFEQSYGFWNDTWDISWRRQQRRAQDTPLFIDKQEATTDPQKAHRWFFRNLQPNFSCPHAERLGTKGAARWTCDPHRISNYFNNSRGPMEKHSKCQIHSVRPVQWSWEAAIHERLPHCQLHIWGTVPFAPDGIHEVPQWAQSNAQVLFHDKYDSPVRSKNSHTMIDILKIECSRDSCHEWEKWPPARQLLLTVQGLPAKPYRFFSKLQQVAGYALFSKEPNLMDGGNTEHFGYIKLRPDFWRKNHIPGEQNIVRKCSLCFTHVVTNTSD